MKRPVTVTEDFTDEFNDIIKSFRNDDILVGIPEDKTNRKDDSLINNATLLAINNFGSPVNNIPPRPVMEIGLRNAQKEITDQFRRAAIDALSKGISALSPAYNRIGSIAANSIKKAINAQEGFDGPAESTLRARKSKGFLGTKALIVTAQMRNAITYVVKNGSR